MLCNVHCLPLCELNASNTYSLAMLYNISRCYVYCMRLSCSVFAVNPSLVTSLRRNLVTLTNNPSLVTSLRHNLVTPMNVLTCHFGLVA